jgi:hypothetical protein
MKIGRFFDLDLYMLKSIIFIIIAFFIMLSGCKKQDEKVQASIELSTFDIGLKENEVVLKNTDYNLFLEEHYCFTYFEPSREDVLTVRKSIVKAIDDGNFDIFREPVKKYIFAHYYFQYIPYVDISGKHVIYINSFCDLEFKEMIHLELIDELGNDAKFDWTNYKIDVADGGACYWNMKVNLATYDYFDLRINGNG